MTVRCRDDGVIVLEGVCPVEDAEALLQMVQATPTAPVDWSQCSQLHTAVLQIILATGRLPLGPCGDAWVAQWVEAAGAAGPERLTTAMEQVGPPTIYPVSARR